MLYYMAANDYIEACNEDEACFLPKCSGGLTLYRTPELAKKTVEAWASKYLKDFYSIDVAKFEWTPATDLCRHAGYNAFCKAFDAKGEGTPIGAIVEVEVETKP